MNESAELAPDADNEDAPAAAVRKSKEALRRLGMCLRSITPAGMVQLLFLVGAPVIVGWVP